jgi:hypothetical protein
LFDAPAEHNGRGYGSWLRGDWAARARVVLTPTSLEATMLGITRGTWFFVVVGGVIGLALGILVSVTTDVPFAPEAGLVLGALVGWLTRPGKT